VDREQEPIWGFRFASPSEWGSATVRCTDVARERLVIADGVERFLSPIECLEFSINLFELVEYLDDQR
jgi:hypothetical protein